jgi:riboflavin synthase
MMFTGIVQAIGRVIEVLPHREDCTLRVDAAGIDAARLAIGASLAVNGVCLTITARAGSEVGLDVSRETLNVTTLGGLRAESRVNLEPALTLAEPLGGHLLSGHVDGKGEIVAVASDGRSARLGVRVPAGLLHYVARKGSLGIDGVSLTVNEIAPDTAFINIVPHTLEKTIMNDYRIGTAVNLEVDLIARYLERLLQQRT